MTIQQAIDRISTADVSKLIPSLIDMFNNIAEYSPSEAIAAYQAVEALESLTPPNEKVAQFMKKLKKAVDLRMNQLMDPNEIHRIDRKTYDALTTK